MDLSTTTISLVLLVLATSAISAIAASGLTAFGLLVFFRTLLNSPTTLNLVEGVVHSFPPQTRELLHIVGQFLEKVSANGYSEVVPTQSEVHQEPPK